MIIGDIVLEALSRMLLFSFRSNRRAPVDRGDRHALEAGEKLVSVTASAMHERAAEHRRWAQARGLGPSSSRKVDYEGEVRGKRVCVFTGLFDTPRPRAAWISVGAERVRFDPFVETSALDTALDRLLATEPGGGYR